MVFAQFVLISTSKPLTKTDKSKIAGRVTVLRSSSHILYVIGDSEAVEKAFATLKGLAIDLFQLKFIDGS